MQRLVFIFILFSLYSNLGFGKSLQGVPFDKADCLKTYGSVYGNQVCAVLEEQYINIHFRKDLVYHYSFSFCDKMTGNMAVRYYDRNTHYCVVYYTENEANRNQVIKSLFGQNPRYPLLYKGLIVYIQVAHPNSLFKVD